MLAMQLQREAETTQPTAVTSNRSFSEWLEDLAAGTCHWEVVLRGVLPAVNANPDSGWELLALVDQSYRLHRISEDQFRGLNSNLQALLLGNAAGARQQSANGPTPAVAPPSVTSRSTVAPTGKASPPGRPADGAQPVHKPAAHAQPPRPLVADEVLRNRYRIVGVLGRGGMGTVYAAIDEFRLDQADGGQRVAIKVLHTDVIKRPKLLAELRSEFQRLQSLSHPNIVRVHDFDRDDELTFLTMEQLSGAPLSKVLTSHAPGALHRPYALGIIRQVGAALAYAHSRGIVHGDLNPGNIFITDAGEVRLLDFGASYRLYREPTIPDVEELSRTAVATPGFGSCEVLQGGPANVRDDIYALACVGYILLTGRHPFQGHNALQARAARRSPRRPTGLSGRQWRALRAGLRFEREHRPGDMQEWLGQLGLEPDSAAVALPPLQTIMAARSPRRRRAGWVTAVLTALVAALCWWAVQNPVSVGKIGKDAKGSISRLWKGLAGDATPDTAAAPIPDEPAAEAAAPPAPAVGAAATAPEVARAVSSAPVAAGSATHPAVGNAAPATAAGTKAPPPRARARIEMAADQIDVTPMNPVAAVSVRRRENYRDNVSFTWWTESGTAKPARDFVPVSPRTEYLAAGEREAQLLIPVVADPRRHESRSFYVVIDQPSDGAKLGSRTITMVTIPPSD
jgi:hypothetical protein